MRSLSHKLAYRSEIQTDIPTLNYYSYHLLAIFLLQFFLLYIPYYTIYNYAVD